MIQLPWKNLKGAPTVAIVDRVYAVLVPQSEYHYDKDEAEAEAWANKKKQLDEIEETQKQMKNAGATLEKQDPGFVAKL